MSDTIQTLTITSETGRMEDGVWIRREAYDALTEQLKEKDKRIERLADELSVLMDQEDFRDMMIELEDEK